MTAPLPFNHVTGAALGASMPVELRYFNFIVFIVHFFMSRRY